MPRRDIILPGYDLSEFIDARIAAAGGATDASFFGLSATADSATNTAAINAAMVENTDVYITEPGVYNISSSDVYGIVAVSNRRLILANGVTIKGASGWRGYLLKIHQVDNFHVEGGTWDGNSLARTGAVGNYWQDIWNEADIAIVGSTNITFRNTFHKDARRRCIWIAGLKGVQAAQNIKIEGSRFDTLKVGIQVMGPIQHATFRDLTFGCRDDDGLAIVLQDWDTAGSPGMPQSGSYANNGGDGENILIENIHLVPYNDGTNTKHGIKLLSGNDQDGTNYTVKNCTIRGVRGAVSDLGIVVSYDVAEDATNTNQFKNLLIEDVAIAVSQAGSFYPIYILCTDTESNVILRDIRQITAGNVAIALNSAGSGVLHRVVVDGLESAYDSTLCPLRTAAGIVNHLQVNNAQGRMTASGLIDIFAQCNYIQMSNCYLVGNGSGNTASLLSWRSTVGGYAQLSNCNADNTRYFVQIAQTTGGAATYYVDLNNVLYQRSSVTSPTATWFRVNSSANLAVHFACNTLRHTKGAGVTNGPEFAPLDKSGAGTHTVRFNGLGIPLDGTLLGGFVEGDTFQNSNAAYGTGVGTYHYTGGAAVQQ